jgi:hypothetical protein
MVGIDEIRAFALALPEVDEGPQVRTARRIAAFKVSGKSFVGLEKGGKTMTISLGEVEAKHLMADQPEGYEAIWRNGTKFMGLRVDLLKVTDAQVQELIKRSWRHCAPKRLVEEWQSTGRTPLQPRERADQR